MIHKLLVILAISALHMLVIFCLSAQKKSMNRSSIEQVIILNLFQLKVPKNSDDDRLTIDFLRIKQFDVKTNIPDINMQAIIVEDDNNSASKNVITYENLKRTFDPRWRDKFQENNSSSIDRKSASFNSWTSLDGTQFVEVGDGECITSMQKLPNTGRGTSWSNSRVKCGKSESERMMENVERGLRRKR
jgi:hypothetical protein